MLSRERSVRLNLSRGTTTSVTCGSAIRWSFSIDSPGQGKYSKGGKTTARVQPAELRNKQQPTGEAVGSSSNTGGWMRVPDGWLYGKCGARKVAIGGWVWCNDPAERGVVCLVAKERRRGLCSWPAGSSREYGGGGSARQDAPAASL